MRKIEIGQQTIDISLRRRGAAPLFATLEPLKTARDAAMRNFRTIMISGANASRDDAERAATLFVVLQGSALSADETIGLINKGRRS